jgi:hypothetical protein
MMGGSLFSDSGVISQTTIQGCSYLAWTTLGISGRAIVVGFNDGK